ncbi:MAG: penicillin acylase family protein [Candidatus Brocadiae bacterium]|nr:penicillin acylase family protein [Candidatus Brocadiia bacterium]
MKTTMVYRESLEVQRLESGVLEVKAQNEEDLYFGQGYGNAMDRGMQMILTRILAQGRATELLQDDEDMLGIDIFFRKMNWKGKVKEQIEKLSVETLKKLQAWCDGVNCYFKQHIPWEMRALRIPVDPWCPEDCLLFLRVISYISLQQTQAEMERVLVQLVQAQVPLEYLKELFPGSLLDGIPMDLIQKVTVSEKVIPDMIPWKEGFYSSNNWALSPFRTESGKALLSNDPHLEGNRFPNVWQEFSLRCKDRYAIGSTIPGLPGILVGRNNDVAWGATYACMDSCDSWIEECKEKKYFKDEKWHSFQERTEIIKRKKHPDHSITFYENEHGILDGNPQEEGFYLSTLWSGANAGAESFENLFKTLHIKNVSDMMEALGKGEFPFSWAIADAFGNIGYQMSGLLPKRHSGSSGLIPLDGRKSEMDWKGFYEYTELPRTYNPPCGYVISSNNDLNSLSQTPAINLPIDHYRILRIQELIEKKQKHSPTTTKELHYDTYSYQAKAYMEKLLPVLDDSPAAKILKEWNLCYDPEQKGPWVFEKFYKSLIREVFYKISPDKKALEFLLQKSSIFIVFYGQFDHILLQEKSLWFDGKSREEIFALVWKRDVSPFTESEILPWKAQNHFTMKNILFQGKIPKCFGFDYGDFALPGGRASIFQGQVFEIGNRLCSYLPSMRFIVDFSKDGLESHLLGGPSDRRFSKWYKSEIELWKNKIYKQL